MKNIKMLFASLVVISVVGGSLAFKAAKFSSFYVYQKSGTTCPVKAGIFDQATVGTVLTNVFTSTTSTLSVPVTSCTSTITVASE